MAVPRCRSSCHTECRIRTSAASSVYFEHRRQTQASPTHTVACWTCPPKCPVTSNFTRAKLGPRPSSRTCSPARSHLVQAGNLRLLESSLPLTPNFYPRVCLLLLPHTSTKPVFCSPPAAVTKLSLLPGAEQWGPRSPGSGLETPSAVLGPEHGQAWPLACLKVPTDPVTSCPAFPRCTLPAPGLSSLGAFPTLSAPTSPGRCGSPRPCCHNLMSLQGRFSSS